MDLRFDNQVAVVTGAGGGLGREYALLLASRGATVVVNDLGSARDGTGCTHNAADSVVQEITQQGGKAIASYHSVEQGDRIIADTVERLGRIDVVINNAGILRDKSFAKMTADEWDAVVRVHLRAVFVTTRAAWPHMRQQQYGRLVFTSSASALFGNFGQANYSAAKCALIGLARTLSVEGAGRNILVNVVVPSALSRLTTDLLPDSLATQLSPSRVAPVVAVLCHRQCPVNGAVVETGGGSVAVYRWQRSAGVVHSAVEQLTMENVLQRWNDTANFDSAISQSSSLAGGKACYPGSATEHLLMLADQLTNAAAASDVARKSQANTSEDEAINDAGVNVERAIGTTLPSVRYTYDSQQTILFALSVGVSLTQPHALQLLYENNERFCVHPMFACLFMNALHYESLASLPGFPINIGQSLHAEHYLRLIKPLPVSGDVKVNFSVVDILDKGAKGAVILLKVSAEDMRSGELYAVQQVSLFILGAGGFGGRSRSSHSLTPTQLPHTEPQHRATFATTVDQAALYRLTGDRNPLHIDPEVSQAVTGGGPPILHGLCSLSGCVTTLMKHYAADQPLAFHSVQARFSRPFVVGDSLLVDSWTSHTGRDDVGDNCDTVLFRCRSATTNDIVISGGRLKLHGPVSTL